MNELSSCADSVLGNDLHCDCNIVFKHFEKIKMSIIPSL